jgi:hypothetical protein
MEEHIVVAGFTFTMEEWQTVGEELGDLGLDEPAPSAFPYSAYELNFVPKPKKLAGGWRAKQAKKRARR